MNKGILLTIITITRDDPFGLARTLASTVGWRARPEVEHVVVYSGEVDRTLEGGGGVVWLGQQSLGIAAAFNEGLACASGEWVWFVNGGDAIHELLGVEFLHSLLNSTRANVVSGGIHFDGEAGARSTPSLGYQWPLTACWLMHPSSIVRRANLLAVGGFSERWRVAADYDLWNRLLARDIIVDVVCIPFSRFDPDGISERAATHRLARGEDARIILKFSARLTAEVCRVAVRLFLRIMGAAWRFAFNR